MQSKIFFGDEKLKKEFDMHRRIMKAFDEIEGDAFCGIQIPKRLIPKNMKRDLGSLLICGNTIFLMLGD